MGLLISIVLMAPGAIFDPPLFIQLEAAFGIPFPAIIETMTWTFRILASASAFLTYLVIRMQRAMPETPPYNRQMNERAHLWQMWGCIVGAVAFTALDMQYMTVTGAAVGDFAAAIVWWCWATGMTCRLAARAEQVQWVWRGASMIVIVLPVYVLVTP